MRSRLTTVVFLLPASRLKNRLLNLLGHSVHPTARLGICLVIKVERFDLAEGVLVNNFNFFQHLALVQIGYGSRIMMLNWILGGSGFESDGVDRGDLRTLKMGAHAHVISCHYLDCGGGLIMSDNSWLTGVRSTVLSHAFDPEGGGIVLEPIVLEKGAVVATSCTMLPGTVVGAGALLAAGSTTWTGQKLAPESLYGGVPARRLAPITVSDKAYQRARYGADESA